MVPPSLPSRCSLLPRSESSIKGSARPSLDPLCECQNVPAAGALAVGTGTGEVDGLVGHGCELSVSKDGGV